MPDINDRMNDSEQDTTKLPTVQNESKPGFFARIFGGAYLRRKEQELQAEYASKFENAEKEIARQKQMLEAERNEMNQRAKSLQERERNLDVRERNLADRELSLNEKARKVEVDRDELSKNEEKVNNIIGDVRDNLQVSKEKVSDDSIKRDLATIKCLEALEETIKLVNARDLSDLELNKRVGREVSRTPEEKIRRFEQITELKASLLGMVTAYGDMLPEEDLHYFVIGDKSYAEFVKGLYDEIVEREEKTPEHDEMSKKHWVTDDLDRSNLPILSLRTLNAAGKAYANMAKVASYGIQMGGTLEERSYGPLSYNLADDDARKIGPTIFRRIGRGQERITNVKGERGGRVTDKRSNETSAEQKFTDIAEGLDSLDTGTKEIDDDGAR